MGIRRHNTLLLRATGISSLLLAVALVACSDNSPSEPLSNPHLDGQTAAGSQVATTTTDATGYFQLPTLPGGEYVVTFVVPVGSIYTSGWTVGIAWEGSRDSPWFIMLRKK